MSPLNFLNNVLYTYWERLKAGGEGDNRGSDGWNASPTQWTCTPGVGGGQGGLACCSL